MLEGLLEELVLTELELDELTVLELEEDEELVLEEELDEVLEITKLEEDEGLEELVFEFSLLHEVSPSIETRAKRETKLFLFIILASLYFVFL